jgi:hypothetical protein
MGFSAGYARIEAKRLREAIKDPDAGQELVEEILGGGDQVLDAIGRGWDVLHFALSAERRKCGSEILFGPKDLLGKAVMGGAGLDTGDDDGACATVVTPADVKKIAKRLRALDHKVVWKTFESQRGDLFDGVMTQARLRDLCTSLRDFYVAASDAGAGVVVVIA